MFLFYYLEMLTSCFSRWSRSKLYGNPNLSGCEQRLYGSQWVRMTRTLGQHPSYQTSSILFLLATIRGLLPTILSLRHCSRSGTIRMVVIWSLRLKGVLFRLILYVLSNLPCKPPLISLVDHAKAL